MYSRGLYWASAGLKSYYNFLFNVPTVTLWTISKAPRHLVNSPYRSKGQQSKLSLLDENTRQWLSRGIAYRNWELFVSSAHTRRRFVNHPPTSTQHKPAK